MNSDRLLTAAEASELLAVPVSWVREHTRAGNVPHVSFPGSRIVRYRRDDLVAWVDSLVEGGGPAWRRYRPTAPESGQRAGSHSKIRSTATTKGER